MNLEKNSVDRYIIYSIKFIFKMEFVNFGKIEGTLGVLEACPLNLVSRNT